MLNGKEVAGSGSPNNVNSDSPTLLTVGDLAALMSAEEDHDFEAAHPKANAGQHLDRRPIFMTIEKSLRSKRMASNQKTFFSPQDKVRREHRQAGLQPGVPSALTQSLGPQPGHSVSK